MDDPIWLRELLVALVECSQDLAIFFPVHPRTHQRISELGLPQTANGRLCLMDPKSYLEFLKAAPVLAALARVSGVLALQQGATVVITDSGGMQEETVFSAFHV